MEVEICRVDSFSEHHFLFSVRKQSDGARITNVIVRANGFFSVFEKDFEIVVGFTTLKWNFQELPRSVLHYSD